MAGVSFLLLPSQFRVVRRDRNRFDLYHLAGLLTFMLSTQSLDFRGTLYKVQASDDLKSCCMLGCVQMFVAREEVCAVRTFSLVHAQESWNSPLYSHCFLFLSLSVFV